MTISKKEMLFRKCITSLGKLPMILLPIFGIAGYVYLVTHDYIATITLFVLVSVTICTSYILGSVVKLLYYKPRPEPQDYKTRFEKIDASSFPSIHTANSMIFAFWGILSVTQIASQSIVDYIFIFIRLFLFMSVSLSRVVLKRHFPIDIIAGVVFGAICISLVLINIDLILGFLDAITQWLITIL